MPLRFLGQHQCSPRIIAIASGRFSWQRSLRWPQMAAEHGLEQMQTSGTRVVEISCEEVWREISNYLEDEISADLRTRMEEHFKGCKRCAAVLDGTRNVVRLFGDATAIELPAGFSERLRQKLR